MPREKTIAGGTMKQKNIEHSLADKTPEVLTIEQIKAIKRQKNIPLKEIAYDLGVTIQRVWYILNHNSSPETLRNISNYMRSRMN